LNPSLDLNSDFAIVTPIGIPKLELWDEEKLN